MAIKFQCLRFGEPGDDGPNGECGVVIVGRDGDDNTAETLLCKESHTHSKACAQALLDFRPEGEGQTTARERITAIVAARKAKKAARSVAADPMPKKTVKKEGKDVQVDDLDLA